MPRKIKGEKVTPPLPALHCPFITMDLVIASCSALGYYYSYGYRILNSNDGITEVSLASGSLHRLFDQVVSALWPQPLTLWVQLPSWMCVHCDFTCGTHPSPAGQACPLLPIPQPCNTVGHTEQPQSSWYTPRSQELLASGPFWIPAPVLSPLPYSSPHRPCDFVLVIWGLISQCSQF